MTQTRLVVLALPGVTTFDLGCAIQVFGYEPGPELAAGRYDVSICGPGGVRVRTGEGFSLSLRHGLSILDQADTIVVPGYATALTEPPSPSALRALTRAGRRGARIMSICVGAFALGHAGLLDGRRATTHWAAAPILSEQFPHAEVVPQVLYVDAGQVLTSAGLAAGLDLALHVVRTDFGAQYAAEIARWNVVAPHRDGSQAQFMRTPIQAASEKGLGPTRTWAMARLHQPLTLADLAAQANVSERTLTRQFRAETGMSPSKWLLNARLDLARKLLETSLLPIETVATKAGFPSGAVLRSHFTSTLKTTPSAYRRRFATL